MKLLTIQKYIYGALLLISFQSHTSNPHKHKADSELNQGALKKQRTEVGPIAIPHTDNAAGLSTSSPSETNGTAQILLSLKVGAIPAPTASAVAPIEPPLPAATRLSDNAPAGAGAPNAQPTQIAPNKTGPKRQEATKKVIEFIESQLQKNGEHFNEEFKALEPELKYADLAIQNKRGEVKTTLLHTICQYGTIKHAQFLKDASGRKFKSGLAWLLNSVGQSPLFVAIAFAQKPSLELLQFLFEYGDAAITINNQEHTALQTPLHAAIERSAKLDNSVEIVDLLMSHFARTDLKDRNQETVFDWLKVIKNAPLRTQLRNTLNNLNADGTAFRKSTIKNKNSAQADSAAPIVSSNGHFSIVTKNSTGKQLPIANGFAKELPMPNPAAAPLQIINPTLTKIAAIAASVPPIPTGLPPLIVQPTFLLPLPAGSGEVPLTASFKPITGGAPLQFPLISLPALPAATAPVPALPTASTDEEKIGTSLLTTVIKYVEKTNSWEKEHLETLIAAVFPLNPDIKVTAGVSQNTILHIAATYGVTELAAYIGKNYKTEWPNLMHLKNSAGESPFVIALKKSHYPLFSLFISGENNPTLTSFADILHALATQAQNPIWEAMLDELYSKNSASLTLEQRTQLHKALIAQIGKERSLKLLKGWMLKKLLTK